uniref:LAGLIDADG endonuclease n=1 Tax=Cryphonectria parasitica TaxID=5116 RepID=A0A191MX98_CRYPA|nr:LAGLIDADG endonuclease [Cryphonectria parasitica]
MMNDIAKISRGMNRNRIDFIFPSFHHIQITRYWLLGFTEAEGSFGVKQDKQAYKGNLAFRYVLSQSDLDLALLEAIKAFLVNIPEAKQSGLMLDKSIYINVSEKRQNHYKNEATLSVTQMELLKCVLVPLFDSMNWFTQKQLDYSLWKSLILLKEKGHHYTEEGFKLIQLLINQMNKHRLSSSGSPVVDRESLNSKIQDMLGKSVYENKNGRVWISSENRYLNEGGVGKEVHLVDTEGNTIKTFKSYSEAARYLKISRGTVFNRIKSSLVFSFEKNLVYLKS